MRRLMFTAALAVSLLATSTATAKLSTKQKDELNAYVTKLAESTDAEAQYALLLVRGVTADAKERKALLALESNEDPRTRLGAKIASMLAGDRGAQDRVAAELIKQGSDFGLLRWSLAPLDDKDELAVLRIVLKDGKPEHATGVFQYLGHARGKLFDELLSALSSPDAARRGLAAKTIVELGRADALEPIGRLLKAKDEAVRREALQVVLAFSRRPDSIVSAKKLLELALKDAATQNRESAARRLVELKDPAGTQVLLEIAKATPKPADAASILGFFVEHEIKPEPSAIAEWLTSDDATAKMRAYQLTAASRDKKFVGQLVEMYGSTEFDDRLLAVQSIGFSGDPRASKVLTGSLFEARADIRAAAVDGLVQLGAADTLDALKRSLTGEKDKAIKLRVIDAIGAVGGKPALQVLRFQVTNSDVDVKLRTVEAIRKIGLKEGAPALDILLRDRNVDLQWRAFLATLALDADAARTHFKTVFRNPPPSFMADIAEMAVARRKGVIAYLLSDGSGSPRDAAIEIVKRDGSNDAALAEIAMSSTADLATRKDLIHFFGTRGDRKDLAMLETIARGKDPTLARLAAWMLTRHPAKGLEASYRGYLASKDETLRAIAAYGLATVWR